MRALRLTGTPPSIDGRLSDEAWRLRGGRHGPDAARPRQRQADDRRDAGPDRVRRPVSSTSPCRRSIHNPVEIAAGLGRRDETPPTDSITIGFDARHDHQTAYSFSTNPVRLAGRLHVLRRHEPRLRLQRRLGRAHARSPTPAGRRNSASRSHRCASRRRPMPVRSGGSTFNVRSGARARREPGSPSRAASEARCRSSATSCSTSVCPRRGGSS